MIKEDMKEILTCKKCGSRQTRTTKDYKICNRCGFKEKLNGNN